MLRWRIGILISAAIAISYLDRQTWPAAPQAGEIESQLEAPVALCHPRFVQTVELKDAQTRLVELVKSLAPGDEIVIETNHKPVARLLSAESIRASRPPRPLREFAGKFRPLPKAEQDDLKMHDRDWCDPST